MTSTDSLFLSAAATSNGRDLPTTGSFGVINPATGEVFAQAPSVTPDQLDGVFAAALTAYESWRFDDEFRRDSLRRAADVIESRIGELAPILTMEQGKPLTDAAMEFGVAAMWLRYYADLDIPREIIRDDAEGFEEVTRRPMGVVSAITPWNFPIALAMWKIAPALRAGNTIVVKPSPYTPLATLALANVLRGTFPDGVLNVVTGPDPLGATMVSHPVPRKVSFTGSTSVGRKVALGAADGLKRITLELGGNDPAVILGDVDVEKIAPSLFQSAFNNNGQICLAVKRVYAHESIQPQLVEALSEIAKSVKVDEGTVDGTVLGPINNKPQFDLVKTLVADALNNGARAAAGGGPIDRKGYFHQPTILDQVDDGMRIVDEEQFGPALPIVSFRDEADVIVRANRGEYGLTASVWSGDAEHAARLAPQIDAGQVSINGHGSGVLPHLPFGGHKSSGIGVENGPWGLHSFTELQVITGPSRH
ncbi:aldehyde dehydrogenase [Rhodococcus sp. ACPA4]|uniref:Acyl-CoA reductase-like NAD-dependent aldehyde dehydrogenase n=1 Tax=Nocardia globerula TaxID=1818 RepID=A0A652YPE6_NOCGL|nr:MULTISPECIES: aldehyde dehydrogenase family protein [Rhodococcus]NMD62778.1 aldehyde dehydrogenase family protein [Nocardia globerula]PBC43946.1 aldehyde dehydrogenase [Rhodococcus sp. ACPA4]PVX68233.1 acyl-CoA reductase-like NAD-dependent aldehyde dehydrogenase [Rhodococcus globerulus]QXW00867.1 aldehyde dehydrogenase family protein [Rhodococcus globerulus]RZL26800.1 MAG: aldehyde dehydrogenase family protein [Rhodococcus sp. (in: high G+C Gram-positive bacteria)]